MEGNRVNCTKCTHFYITWDRNFPKGCKLFGFKSAKMPSITVLEATGSTCSNFELKTTQKPIS